MIEKAKLFKEPQVIVALAIAAVCIFAAAYFSDIGFLRGGGKNVSGISGERVRVAERNASSIGRGDAPITLVEFADFQCAHCSVFYFGAGSVLFNEYIKTGKARFVFKQFPQLGEESFLASHASLCAKEQGKFWEYHDALFTRQSQSEGINTGLFSLHNLEAMAVELQLNKEAFSGCMRAEKYKSEVLADSEDGKAAGVSATPTLFINGRKMEGAFPVDEYRKVMEEEISL